jgi:hypothetical protein
MKLSSFSVKFTFSRLKMTLSFLRNKDLGANQHSVLQLGKVALNLLLVVVLSILLSQCSGSNDESAEMELVTPDGYLGWVAVRWDCPNGESLLAKNDVVKIQFNAAGIACASRQSLTLGAGGRGRSHTLSGKPIPFGTGAPAGKVGICNMLGGEFSGTFSSGKRGTIHGYFWLICNKTAASKKIEAQGFQVILDKIYKLTPDSCYGNMGSSKLEGPGCPQR